MFFISVLFISGNLLEISFLQPEKHTEINNTRDSEQHKNIFSLKPPVRRRLPLVISHPIGVAFAMLGYLL